MKKFLLAAAVFGCATFEAEGAATLPPADKLPGTSGFSLVEVDKVRSTALPGGGVTVVALGLVLCGLALMRAR